MLLLGAIAGDVIGSYYERNNTEDFSFSLFPEKSRFTDDTVLTIAVAESILRGTGYAETIQKYARRYPKAGYGRLFTKWFNETDPKPYDSYGNGAAMRVSPIGFAFKDINQVLDQARLSSEISHDHIEGIQGAQAAALTVHLAYNNQSKKDIKREIETRFGYDLSEAGIYKGPDKKFSSAARDTVPEAIFAFLESTDYEDCIRRAVVLGGDSDTIAAIAGSAAYAYYRKMGDCIKSETISRLDPSFIAIIEEFENAFNS